MAGFYSLTRKVVMAITGLFLIIFLVEHLAGNFLLLKPDGGEAFNAYSKFMTSNPLIRIMEVVLFAGFIFHIVDGLILTIKNRQSRPIKYRVQKPSPDSSWVSRNMGLTGAVIFVYLVIHLRSFFVEHRILHNDAPMDELVKNAFENPLYSAFYVVAMVILGLHLSHGFSSAFQTLGLRHKSYFNVINIIGKAYAILIPAGFASIPIYFYLRQFF